MNDAISRLSNRDLQALIDALRSGRLSSPCSDLQLSRFVPPALSAETRETLGDLESRGLASEQIAAALELVVLDRRNRRSGELPVELVTSGPEASGITNRDTSVVVRELFARARRSVLVVGYAVYQGQRVFEALAERMEELPDLDVRFFLNISRPDGDRTSSEILVTRFRRQFRENHWPAGCRLPELYYDPRSVVDNTPVRSSLHAKCVVVDGESVFVSSANFTEAGQERNIEVGLNIQSPWLAAQLIRHFTLLTEQGLAVRAF